MIATFWSRVPHKECLGMTALPNHPCMLLSKTHQCFQAEWPLTFVQRNCVAPTPHYLSSSVPSEFYPHTLQVLYSVWSSSWKNTCVQHTLRVILFMEETALRALSCSSHSYNKGLTSDSHSSNSVKQKIHSITPSPAWTLKDLISLYLSDLN